MPRNTYQPPRRAADLIPVDAEDEATDQPIKRSTAKTVKPMKAKRIFSYKMDADIGERIRLYARKVADRPVGDVLEQAAREFLERVGG
jgi:hypothetical protein